MQVWEHRVDCGGQACLTYMISKGVRKTRVTPHRELKRTSVTPLWSVWESGRAVDPCGGRGRGWAWGKSIPKFSAAGGTEGCVGGTTLAWDGA